MFGIDAFKVNQLFLNLSLKGQVKKQCLDIDNFLEEYCNAIEVDLCEGSPAGLIQAGFLCTQDDKK